MLISTGQPQQTQLKVNWQTEIFKFMPDLTWCHTVPTTTIKISLRLFDMLLLFMQMTAAHVDTHTHTEIHTCGVVTFGKTALHSAAGRLMCNLFCIVRGACLCLLFTPQSHFFSFFALSALFIRQLFLAKI